FFQVEDCICVRNVTGVQTCALPISGRHDSHHWGPVEQFDEVLEVHEGQPLSDRDTLHLLVHTAMPATLQCPRLPRECRRAASSRSEERRVGLETSGPQIATI